MVKHFINNNTVFQSYANRKNDWLAGGAFGLPTRLCFNQYQDRLCYTNNNKFYSTNPYLKRAVGNFIKGVIHGRFPHIYFQDHASLIFFLHNFNPDLNYSPQALSNVKSRELKFKPLEMTSEIQLFIIYIQKRFPHFKDEWLFYPPSNPHLRTKLTIFDYLTTFRQYIYDKYILTELIFIFLIIPNFYILYLLANLVIFLLFLMIKDIPSLLKTLEYISNNNNYLDDYCQYDKKLNLYDDSIDNLKELDLKVLNPITQINLDLRKLSKFELDELISIIKKEEEIDYSLRSKFLEFIKRNIPKKPLMSITPH
jgi:hypothetical protein